MICLIDADSILYKSGFSYEEKIDWNELERDLDVTKETSISITSNLVEAKNAIDGLVENMMFKTGCDSYELWLTGGNNFRYDVEPTYKSNRKGSRKPIGFTELWQYLMDKYDAQVAVGYEADDVVVTKKTNHPEEYFLCAIDKDVLYQSEGTHYNYGTDEFITTTASEANRFFYYQILAGDTVDGYKGIPKIGKVKAEKLLDETEPSEYWEACVDLCMMRMDLDEDAAVEYMTIQARMASMHQLIESSNGRRFTLRLWSPDIR